MHPWYHWAELENYADTSPVLLTPPYVEASKQDNELLSEFSCLISTITTRILSSCLINNVIMNFYLLPLLPDHPQVCFSWKITITSMPWKHDTVSCLGLPLYLLLLVFLHCKKSFKVRCHCQMLFLIWGKFRSINLLLFLPEIIWKPHAYDFRGNRSSLIRLNLLNIRNKIWWRSLTKENIRYLVWH